MTSSSSKINFSSSLSNWKPKSGEKRRGHNDKHKASRVAGATAEAKKAKGGGGGDNDEILIVDDDTGQESTTSSKPASSSTTSAATQGSRLKLSEGELCYFQRELVTEHDYKTLGHNEYLNDNIINFYLTYLHQNLPAKQKDQIHIYSSHFYSRLKGSGRKTPVVADKSKSKDVQTKTTYAEQCYERVKSWTKKIDIYSKKMLIFPICDEEHWFVIIVCNPGQVLSQKNNSDFEKERRRQMKLEGRGCDPFLLVLDSLNSTHSTALSRIRSYLQFEYMEKKGYPLTFGRDKMEEKHPEIPQQPNSCDCGIFLLHYVELVFKDFDKFLGAKLPNLSKWFTEKEIDYKRFDIAQIIRRLAEDQYKAAIVKDGMKTRFRLPKIRFSAERTSSSQTSPAAAAVLASLAKTPSSSSPAKSTKSVLLARKNSVDRDPRVRGTPSGNGTVPQGSALPGNPPLPPGPPPPEAAKAAATSGSGGVVRGGPPRTPPYPPPPTDSEESASSPSPPTKRRHQRHQQRRQDGGGILSHFPQFIQDASKKCAVVATKLDDGRFPENRRFFKQSRKERSAFNSQKFNSQKSSAATGPPSGGEGDKQKTIIHSKNEMFEELMKGCSK